MAYLSLNRPIPLPTKLARMESYKASMSEQKLAWLFGLALGRVLTLGLLLNALAF
jgi:hypothetical protein